jgi:hypothetical protein
MEKSRILKDPHSSEQRILFDESDIKFDKVLESWSTEIERQASESIFQRTKTLRLFRAWVEPWEQELLFKPTNHVAEAKYLNKYGGLKWLDPDNGDCVCVAASDRCQYVKRHGWSIVATVEKSPTDDDDNDDDEPDEEDWSPTEMLIGLIASACNIQDPKYDFKVAKNVDEENEIQS